MSGCEPLMNVAGAVMIAANASGEGIRYGDHIVAAPHEAYVAQVCYHNHERQNSMTKTYSLGVNGVVVDVSIVAKGGGMETVTFSVPDGLFVYPADHGEIAVADGSDVTVSIVRAGM